MTNQARDSHLKNPPSSTNYDMNVARIRMKGFHEDLKNGNELDAIAVYPVNPFGDPIINEMQVKTVPGGAPLILSNVALNDSDKTFGPVPAGHMYVLDSIYVNLATSATVGDRLLEINILNSSSAVKYLNRAVSVAAAGVTRVYNMAPVLNNVAVAGIVNNMNLTAHPLTEGDTIRIYDVSAVDAAADDMLVYIGLMDYEV